jgi:hypothetical protein
LGGLAEIPLHDRVDRVVESSAMMAGANAAALVETASSSIFRRSQRCRAAASMVSW